MAWKAPTYTVQDVLQLLCLSHILLCYCSCLSFSLVFLTDLSPAHFHSTAFSAAHACYLSLACLSHSHDLLFTHLFLTFTYPSLFHSLICLALSRHTSSSLLCILLFSLISRLSAMGCLAVFIIVRADQSHSLSPHTSFVLSLALIHLCLTSLSLSL